MQLLLRKSEDSRPTSYDAVLTVWAGRRAGARHRKWHGETTLVEGSCYLISLDLSDKNNRQGIHSESQCLSGDCYEVDGIAVTTLVGTVRRSVKIGVASSYMQYKMQPLLGRRKDARPISGNTSEGYGWGK